MTIRDRQLEATRDAILDAFVELARRENAVNISVPAVAEAAQVSVRTVYRHFPTKDELQTAAAFRMSEVVLRSARLDQVDVTTLEPYLRELWTGFAEQVPSVLAEHASPAGRSLRRARLARSRERVARSLPDGVGDPELVDLVVAITSSSMFLELVDRMGHPPDRAAAMAARVVRLVEAHATEEAP